MRRTRWRGTAAAACRQTDALALLRLRALRIDAAAADGLDLIGPVATTPRGPLARRFGAGVLRRLDQALGHARSR